MKTVLTCILRKKTNKNTNNKCRRGSSPWWNDECEKMKRLRKAALLKYKYLSSFDNFINYKQADALAKRCFKKRKREFFLEFCGSLSRTSNLKYVWQTMRSMCNKYHRKETSNAYNDEASIIVNKQINDLVS